MPGEYLDKKGKIHGSKVRVGLSVIPLEGSCVDTHKGRCSLISSLPIGRQEGSPRV